MKDILVNDIITQNKQKLLKYKLPVVLGFDQKNQLQLADLTTLRHILMVGQTGSGKTTFQRTIISTFLQLIDPSDISFFLVDMKRVDLVTYSNLPNLFTNVLVDADEVFLKFLALIQEKARRLKLGGSNYPYIIVIIDTFSDLIQSCPRGFEVLVNHLIPDAAEAKIHVIMSDSRPTGDVFTPSLRKLFPTRIAFKTTNADDAVVVLESNKFGSEKLLGKGNMLFLTENMSVPMKIQAPDIS